MHRFAQLLAFVAVIACRFEVSSAAEKNLDGLLKTFRSEFVSLTPGQGMFPAEISLGSDTGADNERPAHRVRFDEPFSVARYEVPQNLWEAVLGENPSRWTGERNSVERVSWNDCQKFCQRVTELLRQAKLIGDDEQVRLPSEAEWEYFTRAGTSTRYSFGDEDAQLDDFAWHTGNAAGNDPAVGEKRPNPWGLYDVHGYLSEWCADDWHENYQGAPANASPWTSGGDAQRAALRGGSWKDKAAGLTSSARQPANKDLRDDAVGLRCVLAKIPAKP